MTVAQFRKLALSLPETQESQHMDHPDFRVGGKIFATLGYPDQQSGMVKLTPQQQAAYTELHPSMFSAIENAWGKRGATTVHLKAARAEIVMQALKDAWCNTAPKKLISRLAIDSDM